MGVENLKVTVLGLGYVGLPTAAVIAKNGLEVIGYDISEKVVNTINDGKVHIIEDGLEELVRNAVDLKQLRATTVPEESDVFLITVPTPITEDKKADISYVESAVNSITTVLKRGDLIILESTSPVGTTEKVRDIISRSRSDLKCPNVNEANPDLFIAYSPERILPGQTIKELVSNSRVVGGITKDCSNKAISFYERYVKGKIFATNSSTAEMCKLTENAYRDVNIAFANELSMICDKANIDPKEVIEYSNFHPRVNILSPGCGVGGHCIPIDPWFIIERDPENTRLINSARLVNDYKPKWVIEKIRSAIEEFTKNNGRLPKVSLLGLTYKPDIDDMRESPALTIARNLSDSYRDSLSIVEPFIKKCDYGSLGNFESLSSSLEDANIVVKLVNHSSFRNLNISEKSNFFDFS